MGNRARGGGVECPEYYPNTEILFMNLANIHSIRKSFQALRLLCNTPNDQVGKHYLNIFLHDGNVFGRVADGVPKKNTRTFSNEKSTKISMLITLFADCLVRCPGCHQMVTSRVWTDQSRSESGHRS